MKKQKLSFHLNLLLITLTFFISAIGMKANAGKNNAQGSTLESTSYSGNNFTPQNQRVQTQLTNVINSIEINNGQISVPQAVQKKVNQVAINILNDIDPVIATTDSNDNDRDKTTITSDGNEGNDFNINTNEIYFADIISILTEETSNSTVIFPIRDIFIEAGVGSELVEKLINPMQGMILLTPNKQINVDINKLNAAINAYNEIIMKSNAKTLNKLALNQNFMTIRNILNRFRTALI